MVHKINQNNNHIGLYKKRASRNDFGILGPNQKAHESESAGALLKVQNNLGKKFSHKVL